MSLQEWLELPGGEGERTLQVRASITARGMKRLDWSTFAGHITLNEQGGGSIDAVIAESDLDFYARLFMRLATDAVVESPPELITTMQQRAREMLEQYAEPVQPQHDVSAEDES